MVDLQCGVQGHVLYFDLVVDVLRHFVKQGVGGLALVVPIYAILHDVRMTTGRSRFKEDQILGGESGVRRMGTEF